MASGAMSVVVGSQFGLLLMAELLRHSAAIGEAATFREINGIGRVAGDQNAFLAGPFHTVNGGYGR